MSKRLIRYEDYINSITRSLNCSRNDSIIGHFAKLKTEAAKVAGLEKELEEARAASSRLADLQKELDMANAKVSVAEASLEKVKSDKEQAVNELVDVKLDLAREEKARKEAEATIASWKPKYDHGASKMKESFEVMALHMEKCRPFRDDIRPFLAKFEPEGLADFDAETASMDRETNVASPPLVDDNEEEVGNQSEGEKPAQTEDQLANVVNLDN